MEAAAGGGALSEADYRKLTAKHLIKSLDISNESATEAIEIITMAIDKHTATKNYEAAAQLIKSTMDKKFGAAWHCAIGEGFGFDITYQQRNMVYIFYGQVGVLVYKC